MLFSCGKKGVLGIGLGYFGIEALVLVVVKGSLFFCQAACRAERGISGIGFGIFGIGIRRLGERRGIFGIGFG